MPTDCVLLIEDDPELLEALTELIERSGYLVVAVPSADAAFLELEQADFDAVVTDVRLRAGRSGVEVLRKAKDTDPEAQVIMISAHASLALALECIHQGAFDFLEKPFREDELVASIRRAVEHHRLRMSHRMRQACDAISATTDPELLPGVIVETATSVLRASDGSLLLTSDAHHLYVAHTSASTGVPVGALIPADYVASQVLASRQPVMINGSARQHFSGAPRTSSASSSIVFPLLAGERAVGVLTVNRRQADRPFRAADLEDAAVVASHALLALENSRLVRQLAMTSRLAAIGQFANAIVHEINNPLSCVVAGVGSLRALVTAHEQRLPAAAQAELREVADDLEEACALMTTLALDVRALAIDDVTSRLVDLNVAVSTAARIARVEVQQQRASLFLELAPDALVHADVGRLAQALINLIRNAAHARSRNIHVRTASTADHATVEVVDDGCGIPAEDLARIFDPYYTTKGASGGTGLGLWVTREIVQRLGGKIIVRSEVGAGSTFRIEFPRAAPA